MSKKFEEVVLNKLDELSNELKDTSERLRKVEIGLSDTQEIVMDFRQKFTVFDFEINKKIDTLFDSDTVNKENIVSLNVKNYNHDTRITNLENKDLNFAKV